MKTFKELIQSGIAKPNYKPWGCCCASSPATKPVIVAYNNIYGICNNTHMDCNEDGYCITGSFVSDKKAFDVFLDCTAFSNVEFPQTPNEFFKANNLKGFYGYQNGMIIYQLVEDKPLETPEEEKEDEHDD